MWSAKGLIRPYDEIMTAEEKKKFLDQTYPIVKANAMVNGKIMAMIDGLDFWAVYYRLDHLKEIGLDKDHLPKTMEELIEVGHKLDKFDDQHHLRRIGFLPQGILSSQPHSGASSIATGTSSLIPLRIVGRWNS